MVEMRQVFNDLIKAKTTVDVEKILHDMKDELDWELLGNNPSNYGIIAMGSDPYDGITERITNSIDAMIELHVEMNPELKQCHNPRMAMKEIHGFREGSLRWCDRRELGELASDIKVKFLESNEKQSPTIEVQDKGIGQHPSDFKETLVSLNQNYKVTKLYLMGAFGQGGQTSLDNCTYGIVISRKHPKLLHKNQQDLIGWTIVRYNDPSTKEVPCKIGRFEYCVKKGNGDIFTLPSSSISIPFEHGTLIRLVSYKMERGSSDVLQPGGMWSFLSQSLFDPLLPIRLYETRYKKQNQSLTGLAYRLWSGGKGDKVTIKNYDSYELNLGLSGNIKINYWTLSPIDEYAKWRPIKGTFVSRNHAVFITLNGQRHGIESITFLRDKVNLHHSYDYIIVQIDCDGLSYGSKKDLFSTTRDRLKKGDFQKQLLNEVVQHLRNDRNILKFETEKKQSLLSIQSEEDTSNIRKLVGRYIAKNRELSELIQQKGKEKINGESITFDKEAQDDIREEELLIPELKAIPTYLKITNAKDPIPIEKGGNALIRLETDAVDSYFENEWEDRFRCIHEKGNTKKRSCSNLMNGKISYFVYCPSTMRVGSTEEIRFELDLPDGGNLSVGRSVKCITPYKRKKEPKKIQIHEPKIVQISQKKHPDIWAQWGWEELSVGRVIIDSPESAGIYVNIDNIHLTKQLDDKKKTTEFLRLVKDRYVAGVAYYLLLRTAYEIHNKTSIDQDPDEPMDGTSELDRIAHTIAVLSVPIESL